MRDPVCWGDVMSTRSPGELEGARDRDESWIGRADVPRTLDMMAMQGFSTARLGLCTRSVLRGGSRMALCRPVMLGELLFRAGGRRRRRNWVSGFFEAQLSLSRAGPGRREARGGRGEVPVAGRTSFCSCG